MTERICPNKNCGKPISECPCGFCHGTMPVGNGASLIDGKPRPSLPCPRCGRVIEA